MLHSVLDSIFDAVGKTNQEAKIQQLIANGKGRVNSLDSERKNQLNNLLTQASYSFTLAFELDGLYGSPVGPGNSPIIGCAIAAACADIGALFMLGAINDNETNPSTPAQILESVAKISFSGYSSCYCDPN